MSRSAELLLGAFRETGIAPSRGSALLCRSWRRLGSVILAIVAIVVGMLMPAAPASDAPLSDESGIDWTQAKQFWAFRAPVAASRPEVRNRRWSRQPLDELILARLERYHLTPAIEADKRTLVRRVTLDLSGLPPSRQETRAFLEDKHVDAYERLVDRLLASPRFGERLASVWLPLARYAEDQAHQVGDDSSLSYPNAWRYREWVIQAFNRDLPYDRFLTLQLAADQTDDVRREDLAALGFLGLGPKYYDRGRIAVMADEWEDRVDTVTRAMLGLTVGCARCHDHKFDPITMSDYYALAGVFASTRMVNRTADGKDVDGKLKADKMPADTLHVVADGEPKNLNVFLRGSPDRKGPVAERRFLRVLLSREPEKFVHGSGRQELAEAIVARQNPLTARVMVNRLWGCFFGQPLVATPSNFGHSGQAPSQPELLDDLAVRFMDQGWSIKTMVREMVLSATYRQESRSTAAASAADPENSLLSHMPRRRLGIEQWRDTALFVSGELDAATAGRSLELSDPSNKRRTVYSRVSRLKLDDLLMQFDYPDANVHAEKRAGTITPMQRLFMLNSPFIQDRALALASRVAAEAGASESARVRHVHSLLYAREPDRAELQLALDFLRKPAPADFPRWAQYAQMLLASNEMLYVD